MSKDVHKFKFILVYKIFLLVLQQVKYFLVYKISLILIKAAIPILLIYLTKNLIDSINLAIQGDKPFTEVILILAAQLFLTFMNRFISELINLLDTKMNQKISLHFEELLLNRTSKLPLIFFESPKNYDSLRRATSNPGYKGLKIISSFLDIMQNIITLSGIVVILFDFHWLLVLSLIIVIVPNTITSIRIGRKEYNVNVEQSENNRRAAYLSALMVDREALKEMSIFGHSNFLLKKWSTYFKEAIKQDYSVHKAKFNSTLGLQIFDFVMNFVFLSSLLLIVIQGSYSMGDYVSISQSLSTATVLMIILSSSISYIYNQSPYLTDFFSFLDYSNNISNDMKSPHKFIGKIEVSNVNFKYPNSDRFTLSDINFSINKGEKVAIVGENGSGKSTLVKCITGLYDVSSGTILYDGKDLRTIDIRKNISAVFQDFVKYNMTLRENIAISQLDKFNFDNDIILTLKDVEGDVIIEKSGDLDGQLGIYFSNGRDLSGGEWQRVAISRALFKNADIIFFDEPTSSLDPLAESKILELFYKITEGKTTITVTHRLGSCRYADKIIVLKEGEIVGIGSHEELIGNNNYYKSIYDAQAQWYSESPGELNIIKKLEGVR